MRLSTWHSLGMLAEFFVILLVSFCVYTVYFAFSSLGQLRSLRTRDDETLRKSLAVLSRRSSDVRQMTATFFYLFGVTFFLQIPAAFWTPDTSSPRPIALLLAENFELYFRFAAVIFLVFLTLNSVQWFVSSRIRATVLRAGMYLVD